MLGIVRNSYDFELRNLDDARAVTGKLKRAENTDRSGCSWSARRE